MRERRAIIIDAVWKGATGTFEFSLLRNGQIELQIPFLTPEPFIILTQELVDAIETVQNHA